MDTVKETKKLEFPLGEYTVIGSGCLSVRGIRESRDIDILASSRLFNELEKSGNWERKILFHGTTHRKCLQRDGVEVFSNYHYKDYRPKTEDLIEHSDIIDGVSFLRLKDLRDFKNVLGRDKDKHDVALINNYLSSHN
jgi:hypothetical protein